MRNRTPSQCSPQTYDAWYAMGVTRFGRLFAGWRFRCPSCGLAFAARDAAEIGITDDYQGRLCPKGLGGCGYPVDDRRGFKQLLRSGSAGMIAIWKDKRPVGAYFPFAEDEA